MSSIEKKYYLGFWKSGKMVKVHLLNGYCLEGRINDYDRRVIKLEHTLAPGQTKMMLVYTHSISNVEPFNADTAKT